MRFKDLNEAGFASFADQAVDTVDKFASVAAGAYGAFKGAKDKAKAGIVSDIKQAQADAEKAAKEKKGAKKLSVANIPALVAKVVLDRTPDDPDMIEEFHSLGAEEFNDVYAAIDAAKERLSKFPRELRKALKASDFLQDQHRSDIELNDMLGEQPDRGMEAAEEMLMKNLFDEQEVWTDVLSLDDGVTNGQRMVSLMKAISRDFEKRNLAGMTQTKGKKNLPEGTGIVRILSTQRQLIAMRIGLLKAAVDQLAEKPVTEAAMRRVRKLLERMK